MRNYYKSKDRARKEWKKKAKDFDKMLKNPLLFVKL